MAIEAMKKIHLVGHHSIQNRVVQVLQHLGVTQIVNIRGEKEEAVSLEECKKLEDRLSQIKIILKFLNQYEKIGFLKGLWDSFFPPKAYFTKEEVRHVIRSFSEEESFQQYKKIEDSIDSMEIRRDQLKQEKFCISNYIRFPLGKEDLTPGEKIEIFWGVTNQKIASKFLPVLIKKFNNIWMKQFKKDKRDLFLVIVCFKEEASEVVKFLKNHNFEFGVFMKEQKGTFKEHLEKVMAEEKILEEEEKALQESIQKFILEKPKLLLLHDTISNLLKQRYITRNFSKTRSTFILEGWIKESETKILEDKLIGIYPELEVAVSPIPSNAKPPIAFINHSFFKPFEFITRLYGAPNYFEFDPTPFLTPFFIIFFSLCITDAGYGLILLVLGLWLYKKMKLAPNQKLIFKVLIFCGFLTVIFGMLMGSFFSIDFTTLSPAFDFLKNFRQKIMLFDPLEDIMLFLGICLGLGLIQIYFGIILKVIMLLKRKKKVEAFLQELPWIFLITGLILLLGVHMAGLTKSLLPLAKVFSLGGAVVILLFAGRGTKNLLLRLAKGLYALYGTVGMLGDILSYSRLLALGLATTVIGLAVNIIAGLFSQVPFLGFILGFSVLILGHGFNLFINSLGGFAHTLRLQFVEFFTKFYEGGGDFFEPFKLENDFTEVSN